MVKEAEVMMGHADSSASEKKSSEPSDKAPPFNNWSRTFMSIIAGVIAGLFRMTALNGYMFYILAVAITSAGRAAKDEFSTKAGFSTRSYFSCWERTIADGVTCGLVVFIAFWTYACDFVRFYSGGESTC